MRSKLYSKRRQAFFTIVGLILLSAIAQAQNKFVEGTLVRSDGSEQAVLIRYNAWKLTPQKFRYKLPGSEEILSAEIDEFSEVIISDLAKFVATEVRVDISSDIDMQLTAYRAVKWETQTLFLEEIMSEGVKLYFYKTGQYERFFYKKPDSDSYEQLVYKRYREYQSHISQNREYRKQIQDNLQCEGLDYDLREIDYKTKDMIAYFEAYNQCLGYEITTERKEKPKAQFHFAVKAGVSSYGGEFTKIQLDAFRNLDAQFIQDYESSVGVNVGIVGELVLPYQNNQWSLLIEGQFESFKTEGVFPNQIFQGVGGIFAQGPQPWSMNLSHFMFSVGLRKYFFLEETQKLFLNAGFNSNFVIQFGSEKEVGLINETPLTGAFIVDLSERINPYGGLGFAWSKYSVEARYNFPRQVTSDLVAFSSKYTALSLMMSMRL